MPSSKSQPISKVRRTWREQRLIWHIATVIVAAVALQLPAAVSADAGPHRARLSSELAAYLASTSGGTVDVIVCGSVEKIDRIASRHGLSITKQLSSCAVVTVSRDELDALSQDLEVETPSDNA